MRSKADKLGERTDRADGRGWANGSGQIGRVGESGKRKGDHWTSWLNCEKTTLAQISNLISTCFELRGD